MKKIILFAFAASLSIAIFAQNTGLVKTKPANKQTVVKDNNATLNMDLLIGTWKTGDQQYTFSKNGNCQYSVDSRTCPGTWTLNSNTLTLNPKHLMYRKGDPCINTKVFEVVSADKSKLVLADTVGKKDLHLKKKR